MPTCQQTMSVTVSGPFTIGPTVSPSATSSHQRGSAPRGPSDAYWASISAICVVGVGRELDVVVLLALPGLGALGADHEAVLRRQERAVLVAEDLAGPLVHGPLGELARLVEHADQGVAPADAVARPQRRPPLAGAGRVEGVDAAERVALHQVAVLGGDLGDLVLADQGVAADQHAAGRSARPSGSSRRRRGRTTAGCRRRRPRRRAGTRRWSAPVVRRLRVRLGDADARRRHPLVGDPADGLVGDGAPPFVTHEFSIPEIEAPFILGWGAATKASSTMPCSVSSGGPVGAAPRPCHVEGLEGRDHPAEQAGEHLGVAGAQVAGGLATTEQVGVEAHGVVEAGVLRIVGVVLAGSGQHEVRRPQEEAGEVRVGAEEADLDVDQPVQLVDGGAAGVDRRPHRSDDLGPTPQEDLAEQVALVVEERVHRPDRELGEVGHLLQRRGVVALGAEHLLGGVEQLRTADVEVLHPAAGRRDSLSAAASATESADGGVGVSAVSAMAGLR